MRLTRAAQRAQHGSNEEVDATATQERAPLNEISPNASPELDHDLHDVPQKTPAKKGKAQGGAKKGKKGKKGKGVEEEVQVVVESEQETAVSPTCEAAVEDSAQESATVEYMAQPYMDSERPTIPPPKPVRLTRRQLAKQEEELKQSQHATEEVSSDSHEQPTEEVHEERVQASEAMQEQEQDIATQAASLAPSQTKQPEIDDPKPVQPEVELYTEKPEPKTIVPLVATTAELEPKMLSCEKPCGDATTPIASRTSSRRASRSPSKSPMRIEESIEALDALEDALENVEALTNLHSSDEKSPRKATFLTTAETAISRSKTPSRAPSTTLKVAKNARGVPNSIKHTASSLARSPSARMASDQSTRKGSADPVDYLASKRRPISVSFPTPPPPPKGRAPTKATFQLSSTAVAEKLKAEKEERLKRQEEYTTVKQRPISMTLPPKSTKPLTKANFELPGEKIAAELRAKREERLLKKEAEGSQQSRAPRPISMPPVPKSTKPLTKANFELPGSAVAAKLKQQREERLKRQEEAEAARKAPALAVRPAPARKPAAMPSRAQAGVTIPPPQPQTHASSSSASSSSATNKRNSIQLSNSPSSPSGNRNSVVISKSTVTPVDAAAQKVKGKEVFNRDKMEKEAKERERREKEEAAKKARAEAAERGRIASREWAEKQRKKMMGASSS